MAVDETLAKAVGNWAAVKDAVRQESEAIAAERASAEPTIELPPDTVEETEE